METKGQAGILLNSFNFLASLINGNIGLARWRRRSLTFNFLASLINGNIR